MKRFFGGHVGEGGTRMPRTSQTLAAVLTAVVIGSGASAGVAFAKPAQPGPAGVPAPAPAALAASNCNNNGADHYFDREEVLRRARSWLNNTQNDTPYDVNNYGGDWVPYSQDVCHTNSYGSYRQDCSGFVAMAWGLGGVGDAWWTGNLVPASSGGHTVQISQSELAPGDALLFHNGDPNSNHVALFVRWTGTGALVYEQTGATERPRVANWAISRVNSYTPIRYTKLAASLVSGQNGYLNLIRQDGNLDWYQHTGWGAGTNSWGPQFRVGSGWNAMDKVVGDGRTLFGIWPDGRISWYRYDTQQGWDPASQSQIGVGWDMFKFVMSAANGVIYGITYSGDLRWYRYNGTPGSGGYWSANSGKVIGTGWGAVRSVAAADGVIYAVTFDGRLMWYRYLTPYDGGDVLWVHDAGVQIGTGWVGGGCGFEKVVTGGAGRLYAVDTSGTLRWQRQVDPVTPGTTWDPSSSCGNQVGTGWR